MGEMRNACNNSVGNLKSRDDLEELVIDRKIISG
jgi:hypothetical protein